MRYCACTHPEELHAEDGAGYCFAEQLNGQPCPCERFRPQSSEARGLAEAVGDDVRRDVERRVVWFARTCASREGSLPFVILAWTPEGPVAFELIFDNGTWLYQSVFVIELAGVPAQTWRVEIARRKA